MRLLSGLPVGRADQVGELKLSETHFDGCDAD